MATGLAEGMDGQVWIGSYGDGLLRLDGPEGHSEAQASFAARNPVGHWYSTARSALGRHFGGRSLDSGGWDR